MTSIKSGINILWKTDSVFDKGGVYSVAPEKCGFGCGALGSSLIGRFVSNPGGSAVPADGLNSF
jgi:hypothetical protein